LQLISEFRQPTRMESRASYRFAGWAFEIPIHTGSYHHTIR
jgi:hypothetical protein